MPKRFSLAGQFRVWFQQAHGLADRYAETAPALSRKHRRLACAMAAAAVQLAMDGRR